jgi:AAA15 family ATPase/GTPase
MQLIIQNFGPIKQGKIDLTKKFYVFVGYNNTGKTYVSQLLWSIFNEETIFSFSKSFIENPELNLDKEDLGEGVESTFDITPEIIDKVLRQFALFLEHKIVPKIFNINKQHFILEQFSLDFEYDINTVKKRSGVISFFPSSEVLRTISKEKDSLTIKLTEENISKKWPNIHPNTSHRPFVATCYELIISLLFNTHHHQPVFLPSSRLFYPLFYSYIYRLQKEKYDKISKKIGEILENKQEGELIDLESFVLGNGFERDYTEPMNVLFDKLYRLNEDMTVQNHYEHLVAEMTTILGGDIIMSKKEGIAPIKFGFKPTQHDNHLPMFLSSSSVNQLSTLYLYFKYWAQKEDNFLMIDEPEENLHPKNQIALLNVLLAYVQANNNKVLIITHSPLLADAINNYLYLFWLKSQQVDVSQIVEDYYPEMNPDIDLSADDIAIYFFEGTRIIPYKRGDYGVLFSDFDAEQRKIKKIELALTEKMYQLLNDDEEY